MRRYCRSRTPDRLNDRFDYELHAGETYYLVVDANQPDTFGDFSLFSHYGACGAVPAPQCEVDTDCLLGQRCTEQRQCITPIGTCDDPTQITELGTYNNRLGTARNLLDPRLCDACPNPGGGRCGEAVYLYQPEQNGRVCVSTAGSNYDTVLYARRGACEAPEGEIACNDDVGGGSTQSQLQLDVQAGQAYYFVTDAWSSAGQLSLTISEGNCP